MSKDGTPAGNINDLEKFKNEASSAEMGEAHLGGIRGLGTLHVVRDQIGSVYEVAGLGGYRTTRRSKI